MNSLFIPIIGYQESLKVEQLAREKYKVPERQMVIHVGMAVASLTKHLLEGKKNVLVIAGPGNNGADALCGALNLHTSGYAVSVYLTTETPSIIGQEYKQILESVGVLFHTYSSIETAINSADIIIDGMVGYNLQGNPRGLTNNTIQILNTKQKPIVSIDVPTGYELKTGLLRTPHVTATATLCLGLVKEGLDESFAGILYATHIGIPPEIYKDIGVEFEHEKYDGLVQVEMRS